MISARPRLYNISVNEKIIEGAFRELIKAIGEDPDREGLARTPERIADLYRHIFSGVGRDPMEVFRFYTVEHYDEMVVVKDIDFFSVCEHHFLPFFGKAHIAYIPAEGRITGAMNLIDVLEVFSHRPTIQERLTTEVADFLYRNLKPMGVLVVTEARHLCLEMIGKEKPGTKIVASAMRGYLRKAASRAEALRLIGKLSLE